MKCTICGSTAVEGRGRIRCDECSEYLDMGMPTLNCEGCNPTIEIEMGKEEAEKFIRNAKNEWLHGWEYVEQQLREGSIHPHADIRYADMDILDSWGVAFLVLSA